jgi:hypothetical protein
MISASAGVASIRSIQVFSDAPYYRIQPEIAERLFPGRAIRDQTRRFGLTFIPVAAPAPSSSSV